MTLLRWLPVFLALACTGARAPERTVQDFNLPKIGGGTLRLSDHVGRQVVLMIFFATWSGTSTTALINMQKLHEDLHRDGLLVLGIAVDGPDSLADVAPFVGRNTLAFPVVADQDSHVTARYNPRRTVPLFVLIDRHASWSVIRDGYSAGDDVFIRRAVSHALMK